MGLFFRIQDALFCKFITYIMPKDSKRLCKLTALQNKSVMLLWNIRELLIIARP